MISLLEIPSFPVEEEKEDGVCVCIFRGRERGAKMREDGKVFQLKRKLRGEKRGLGNIREEEKEIKENEKVYL